MTTNFLKLMYVLAVFETYCGFTIYGSDEMGNYFALLVLFGVGYLYVEFIHDILCDSIEVKKIREQQKQIDYLLSRMDELNFQIKLLKE